MSSVGTLIVIGGTGVGKSSWLNQNFENANFQVGGGAEAITKYTSRKVIRNKGDGKLYAVYDTQGLFDAECPLDVWLEELMAKVGEDKFHQTFYLVNASNRFTSTDKFVVKCLGLLTNTKPASQAITTVFTKCDAEPKYIDEAHRRTYIESINNKVGGNMALDPSKTMFSVSADQIERQPAIVKEIAQESRKQGVAGGNAHHQQAAVTAIRVQNEVQSNPQGTKINNSNPKQVVAGAIDSIKEDLGEKVVDRIIQEQVSCYDAEDTMVLLWHSTDQEYKEVLAADVTVGDQIQGRSLMPEEVLIKNVHEQSVPLMFRTLTIVTSSGSKRVMTLSMDHFVAVCTSASPKLVPASQVQEGDEVEVVEDGVLVLGKVESIVFKTVSRTISLRTKSLTMNVNGIVGSCQSLGDAGMLGHILVRIAATMFKGGGQKLQNVGWFLNKYVGFTKIFESIRKGNFHGLLKFTAVSQKTEAKSPLQSPAVTVAIKPDSVTSHQWLRTMLAVAAVKTPLIMGPI